jgi:hypothetical protein
MSYLAECYHAVNRPTDALPLLQELLDKRRNQAPPLDLADTLTLLGSVLIDLHRTADAELLLREGCTDGGANQCAGVGARWHRRGWSGSPVDSDHDDRD